MHAVLTELFESFIIWKSMGSVLMPLFDIHTLSPDTGPKLNDYKRQSIQ